MTASLSVLRIEDNPRDAALIRHALAGPDAGASTAPEFHLVCMDRLASGLTRLDDEGVDIVLLNLSLPDSQGLESVSQVRARSPRVPIVVMRSNACGSAKNGSACTVNCRRPWSGSRSCKGSCRSALCKRIRDTKGDWQPVEVYVKKHSDADFPHGICPSRLDKHYPMFKDDETPGPG